MKITDKRFFGRMNLDDASEYLSPSEYRKAYNLLVGINRAQDYGYVSNAEGTNEIFQSCTYRLAKARGMYNRRTNSLTSELPVGTIHTATVEVPYQITARYAEDYRDTAIFYHGCYVDYVKKRIYIFATRGAIDRDSTLFYYDIVLNRVVELFVGPELGLIIDDPQTGLYEETVISGVGHVYRTTSYDIQETVLYWSAINESSSSSLSHTNSYIEPKAIAVERAARTDYTSFTSAARADVVRDIKRVPSQPIVSRNIDLFSRVTKTYQFFEQDNVQFALRYVYYTGEQSVWSTVSASMPLNLRFIYSFLGDVFDEGCLNSILLNYTDPRISSYADYSTIIEFIDIAYRENDVAPFKILKRIKFPSTPPSPISINKLLSNDFISYDDYSRPFENIPLKVGTLSIIKNRKYYADCIENYDYNPDYEDLITSVTLCSDTEAETLTTGVYLKPDCEYQVGFYFSDDYGRKSSVYTKESFAIKTKLMTVEAKAQYFNSGITINRSAVANPIPNWYRLYYIKVTINAFGNIPPWATRINFVMTEGQSYSFFIVAPVNNIQYVKGRVKDNIKTYTVTVGSPTAFSITGAASDILPGDKVMGKGIPDGTIVAEVYYNLGITSVLISNACTYTIASTQRIHFQSVGIQPAQYIQNQMANTNLPEGEVMDDQIRRFVGKATSIQLIGRRDATESLDKLGDAFGGAGKNIARKIDNAFTNSRLGRKRKKNKEEAAKRQETIELSKTLGKSSANLVNYDFGIGDPIYNHRAYYPIGAQVYDMTTNAGAFRYRGVNSTYSITDNFGYAAKELHIDISNWVNNGVYYVFERGDLITIYRNANLPMISDGVTNNGTYLPNIVGSGVYTSTVTADDVMYRLPILEQRGNTLIVELPSAYTPAAVRNFFNYDNIVHIIRPKDFKDTTFFEVGMEFPTNSVPSTIIIGNGRWDYITSSYPDNTNKNMIGDAYLVNLRLNGNTDLVRNSNPFESLYPYILVPYPNETKPTFPNLQGLGRINTAATTKEKQIRMPDQIKYTDSSSQTAQVSFYSAVDFDNEINIGSQYGRITKLEYISGMVLIICQNDVFTGLVDESRIVDAGGNAQILGGEGIDGIRILLGRAGTSNVTSIVNTGSAIYWFSDISGSIFQYTPYGGIKNLSDIKLKTYFDTKTNFPDAVYAGYHPNLKYVLFTFPNYTVPERSETIAYSENQEGWVSFYELGLTQIYAPIDDKLYTAQFIEANKLKSVDGIGSVKVSGTTGTVLTGTGTAFTSQIRIGDSITVGSFMSVVTKITSDTLLEIAHSIYITSLTGYTINQNQIPGLSTLFTNSNNYGYFFFRKKIASIEIDFNTQPSYQKVFNNFLIEGTNTNDVERVFKAIAITTQEKYPTIQTRAKVWELINQGWWSRVPADFSTKGGPLSVDMKSNINDINYVSLNANQLNWLWNGYPLISNVLRCIFANNSYKKATMFAINLFSQISERTNK